MTIIFSLLKKHWKEILLVSLICLLFLKGRHDAAMVKQGHDQIEQTLVQEIESLKQAHTKELEQRDEALSEYLSKIEEIEGKYTAATEKIKELSEVEKEKHIQNFSQDQSSLADSIRTQYGFTHVP
jgi:predicted nucleic acid-binding protein